MQEPHLQGHHALQTQVYALQKSLLTPRVYVKVRPVFPCRESKDLLTSGRRDAAREDHTEERKKSLKGMKRKKIPGEDVISIDLIMDEGKLRH